MFEALEQSERFNPVRQLMTFLVSTAVHAIAVLALVVLPLVFIRGLPEVELLSFLLVSPAPPPLPPPAPPVIRTVASSPRVILQNPFVPPVEIPSGIPEPGPETEAIPWTTAIAGASNGIPDGIQGGVAGSPLGSIINSFTVPKPVSLPPRPVARAAPQTLGGNVMEGKLIRRVEPVYPRLALLARVSGIVILEVSLDEEGNVQEVRILRGHPLLDDAAVQAVRQWKYSPTLLNGEPVPVVGTVTVVFSLR